MITLYVFVVIISLCLVSIRIDNFIYKTDPCRYAVSGNPSFFRNTVLFVLPMIDWYSREPPRLRQVNLNHPNTSPKRLFN